MENSVVNEENVKVTEDKVVNLEQPVEGTVEGAGTPIDGGDPEPAADAKVKPTLKERFVKGCKTFGNGCKTVTKAAKPYVVGAAGGIAIAGITLYKVYKATHTEGGEALDKQETPLLGMDYNPETDGDFDVSDATADTDGAGINTSSDVTTEFETGLETEL